MWLVENIKKIYLPTKLLVFTTLAGKKTNHLSLYSTCASSVYNPRVPHASLCVGLGLLKIARTAVRCWANSNQLGQLLVSNLRFTICCSISILVKCVNKTCNKMHSTIWEVIDSCHFLLNLVYRVTLSVLIISVHNK